MGFLKKLPVWSKKGVEPPNSKKTVGWQEDERPPAEYMNWFQNTTYEAVDELQKNAVHKDDFNQKTNELTTQLADTVIPSSFDVMGGVRDIFKPPLDSIKVNINTSLFNVGFITDAHYQQKGNAYPYANYSLSHTQNITYLSDKLDVIVCGGDNVNSDEMVKGSLLKRVSDFADSIYDNSVCDSFLLMGNHDDGSYFLTQAKDVIQESEFAKYWGYNIPKYAEVRPSGKSYFYKDYPSKKIRVIGLDTTDVPVIIDEFGNLKYRKINTYGIGQTQLNWIINQALGNMPNDYHALIFSHHQITGRVSDTETHYNLNALTALIDSFKTGEAYTYTGTIPDFECIINKPVTTPKNIVACFYGHIHVDTITTTPKGVKMVSTRNSVTEVDSEINTLQEDSFDIISINTATKSVTMTRFGRGSSRNFTY